MKKKSFDKETLIKVGKGALIAFTGAGSLALLNYVGTLKIEDPAMASFVAFIVPVLVNLIKEYYNGNE